MMMSPQIMKRQAGRRQFYLQTNFLTIISSLAPLLVSRASVCQCLLSVSLEWALHLWMFLMPSGEKVISKTEKDPEDVQEKN